MTLVRSLEGDDLFSRGRIWIEPSSGRALMGELVRQNGDVTARLTVSFQSEPLLGLLVPVEMREQYMTKRHTHAISGTATYGKFRQFRVRVDEKINPIR